MKTTAKLVGGLFILLFCIINLNAEDKTPLPNKDTKVVITPELKKKYPIKKHHQGVYLECVDCHAGQGNDPEQFEEGDEEKTCLECHGKKEHVAERTKFMDSLKANPHNSVHDGPTLYCDECHHEHEKSENMCTECHEKEVSHWMKETP